MNLVMQWIAINSMDCATHSLNNYRLKLCPRRLIEHFNERSSVTITADLYTEPAVNYSVNQNNYSLFWKHRTPRLPICLQSLLGEYLSGRFGRSS